ncbi:hypothetical protein CISIN_1g0340602mg, partial [Citrus sinensis]
MEDRKE